MYTILLVEDDKIVAASIRQVLAKQNFRVEVRETLEKSYTFLREQRPDLAVVDRNLPDGDGVELVEYLEETTSLFPILILSGYSTLHDRITGLEKGADDYLVKPFSTTELRLRIEKLLAKTKQLKLDVLEVGALKLHLENGRVEWHGKVIRIRKREFEILQILARYKNRVVSRKVLIDHLWPDGEVPTEGTIDVYVRRLRMLLGKAGQNIQTIRGYGYTMVEKKS